MKHPPTIEEHRTAGRALFDLRNYLLGLSIRFGNKYPRGSKAHRRLFRALEAVDALRCELDNRIFHEHPELPNAASVYYPGPCYEDSASHG